MSDAFPETGSDQILDREGFAPADSLGLHHRHQCYTANACVEDLAAHSWTYVWLLTFRQPSKTGNVSCGCRIAARYH